MEKYTKKDKFPNCAKNCEAVKMLGAGECESVCPQKFINNIDEKFLDFLNDLQKLTKKELINYIGTYWFSLRENAETDMNNKDYFMAEEYGKIKMTQVNRLRNLAKFQSSKINSDNYMYIKL